ncbi:hypothetical protein K7957_18475 [Sphingomonas yunnanensis]|uniref:hypothetical protein n=1 Tax=Sphingomonas yunnanensis TaxID=310400 RepID=UPI001CA69A53|nr:hypothetical protein [Sphingomonas yunnanensis]MBY9064926.1 hypothetical protein [Sphingomonas yunnanensis]
MRKFPARLLGVLLLAAATGTSLLHRAVYETVATGPAHPAEFALGLVSFLLATGGILLLVHGRKLLEPSPQARPERATSLQERFTRPISPASRAFDTRRSASLMQARHVLAVARARSAKVRQTATLTHRHR